MSQFDYKPLSYLWFVVLNYAIYIHGVILNDNINNHNCTTKVKQ